LLLGIFLHHPHPSTAEDGLDFGSGFLPLMKIFHHLLKESRRSANDYQATGKTKHIIGHHA
jgi:hypothetical protein